MKRLGLFVLIILLLLPVNACSSAPASGISLRFGAMPSIDVLPFAIAEQKGYFKARGVDFHLELFQSAKDRDAAFQAGALDGFCCDEVAVCIYRNAGTDLKITGLTDGEYALVAGGDSGITEVAGLKGKNVAISENTLIEYVLDAILKRNGMEPSDVEKLAVPAVPVRLEMLKENHADAALLPEPFATLAVNDGGRRLASALGMGLRPTVIAFTGDVIKARRSDIAAMYSAYDEAVDFLNNTPVKEIENLTIQTVGYPESMKGRIELPKFTKHALPPEADLRSVVEWASGKGLCPSSLAAADMDAEIQ